jgi:hypothetical protein
MGALTSLSANGNTPPGNPAPRRSVAYFETRGPLRAPDAPSASFTVPGVPIPSRMHAACSRRCGTVRTAPPTWSWKEGQAHAHCPPPQRAGEASSRCSAQKIAEFASRRPILARQGCRQRSFIVCPGAVRALAALTDLCFDDIACHIGAAQHGTNGADRTSLGRGCEMRGIAARHNGDATSAHPSNVCRIEA